MIVYNAWAVPKLIFTNDMGTYTFEVGDVFRIGRHPDNDLPLRESKVSRWHAEIRREMDHYRIIDLDSLNGTRVNEERVQNRNLQNGDAIKIGDNKLIWQEEEAPHSREDAGPFSEGDVVKSVSELRVDEPVYAVTPGAPPPEYARAPEHLYLLLQIARLLNSAPSLDEFLEKTLETVLESLEADRGAILVEEAGVLSPRKMKAHRGEFAGSVPVSSTITRRVMKEGVGVLSADARNDPRFEGLSISAYDIRSAICVPLWESGKARGVFYMDNLAVDRAFTEADLDITGAIAHHLALGFKYYETIEKAKREAVLRHQLERYHSPDMVDFLLRQAGDSQEMELAPREQEVTVLFCDIVDFCSIASRLSATDTAALLSAFYDEMTGIIFRHSGSVNKFIGDAVMALWGAPFSHGDDAKKAARCAAEMMRSLYGMLKRLERDKWFKIRIGINTGKVISGHVGSKNMLEYTVIGTPVNIASRIQSMARPNQVLIGETTRARLGQGFPTVDLGYTKVKGAEEEVKIYELVWKEVTGE